jgi:hypothetical protein
MKTYEFFSSGFGSSSSPRFSSLGSFITWADKRYREEEYDDEEFEEIISILENECKQFLDEVKEGKVGPIFRGAKNVDDTYTKGLGVKGSRIDRAPLDTRKNVSEILDNCFEEKFGLKLRSSGVFASKLPTVASDYGRPYLFFPIGDYEYFWNPDVKDLYGDIEGTHWYYIDESDWQWQYGPGNNGDWCYDGLEYDNDIITAVKRVKEDNTDLSNKSFEYVQKLLDWEPAVSLEDYMEEAHKELQERLEDIVYGYVNNQIDKIVDQEITFVCDKYYLVDPAFYVKYLEYLNDKNLDEYKKNNPD